MKLSLVFLAACLAISCAYEKDGDVLVLTDSDFDAAIKEHEFILVEFYAPWCGHCKSLAPEYAKAATTLSKLDTPIPIAKVDATENSECSGKHDVRGYPTLKWFVNGEATEYGGGRTADTIVSWVKKRTGPPCKPLADKAAVESFTDGAEVCVVAFQATDSDNFATLEKAARGIEEAEFGVADPSLASDFDAKEGDVVLFKKFDEGRNTFEGDFSADAITEFVQANSVPLVSTFTQESASKIFGSGIDNHFLYFNDEKDATFEAGKAALAEVAKEFKGKTLFVHVPASEDRVLKYFDLEKDDLPAAVLVNLAEGGMKKFAYSGEINAEGIKAHVTNYHAGELKPTLKSEEAPKDNDGPVTVIVGSTFNEIALAEGKDVMVEFYAPWCGHCKSLAPTWEELGESFADNANVVIAKIDATANDIDHPKVNVKGFPTLIFFPADNKDDPITYDGGRDADSLSAWIKEKGTAEAAAPEKKITHDDL